MLIYQSKLACYCVKIHQPKEHIRCGRKKYDNSTAFYGNYFGADCEKLVAAIRAYKQHNGSHKKDEHYLAELLK